MTTSPDCGLVGCGISERLQDVVEHGHRLLPGGTPAAPPPPPPEPAAWWASPWLLALGLVLVAVLVALAVRRSPRLQGLVQAAVAAARVQAQPAAVARWGGPLGRAVLAVVAGAWRFVRAGHGARSQAWRAVAVLVAAALVVGSPLGAGGFLLGAVSTALGVPVWLLVLALVGVLAAVVVASRDEHEDTAAWWSERRLLAALRSAGIVPALRADEPEVSLRRRGTPQHSEHGTAVVFDLPGQPWTLLAERRERLAAALRLDADRLVVEHPDGAPANVVRLFVGTARRTGSTPAEVGSAERTRWSEPVRIGCDPQGAPVHLATDEQNALLAGVPGSGKTSVARAVLGHYLLDPATLVYGLDGKGSRKDYGAAVPLCARWVSGVTEDAAAELEAMLGEVLAVVRSRNSAEDEHWPGVLLLLEELQDVRAAADKATRERLDNVLGRIIRMGRAVGVSVLISTQRPTVDDVPAGVRNLVSQRLALMLRNGADAALVLGTTPTLPLPSRRGQALLTTPAGTQAVALDLLDADAWTALCARAAALRATAPAYAAEPARSPFARPVDEVPDEPEAQPEPEAPVLDPLVAAVVGVLRDSDPRGLPASALLARLPEWLAPATPAALGRALRGHPALQRGHVGKAPVWRLAQPSEAPGAPLGEPSADPRRTLGPRDTEGSQAPAHAQTGAAVAQPSEPSAVAP